MTNLREYESKNSPSLFSLARLSRTATIFSGTTLLPFATANQITHEICIGLEAKRGHHSSGGGNEVGPEPLNFAASSFALSSAYANTGFDPLQI